MPQKRRGRPPYDDLLTQAEWRIVHAVRHGMSNGDIARRRGISLDAVKYHVANAVAKLGLKNRQELRRWRGIPKNSALQRRKEKSVPETTQSASKPSEPAAQLGPIGQISRTVRDITAAEAWYGGVLGLPHLYTFGKLAFFDCGGTRLYLDANRGEALPESILYLRVADIAGAHETLAGRGVEFTSPPHMIFRHPDGTEEWMAFFKDPDGRPLALLSQVTA